MDTPPDSNDSRLDLFLRNRRLLVLLICLVMVGGLSALVVLPRMEDPSMIPRAQNIVTRFPGRTAVDVETQVSELIEDKISEIEEVKEYRSISRAGVSFIAVELRDEVDDSETVWARLRDKVANIEQDLPEGASKPSFDELDFKANAMIVALEWSHDSPVSYAILRRSAEQLKDELNGLVGTEKVDLFGDPEEEITVELDSARIAAMELTTSQVAAAVFGRDAKRDAGQVRGAVSDLLIGVGADLRSVRDVANVTVKLSGGGEFVRLGDIATIRREIREPVRSMAIVNGNNAVVLGLLVRDNYRIDVWAPLVKEKLEKFESSLPAGVELKVLFQQNHYVEDRLHSLAWNLLFGGLAVFVVILVMMGWRNALIVSSALPFTAMVVLTGLNLLGIPIHQMSVTGIIIALGLLIDNAIVIVDEVTARLRAGKTASEAIILCLRQLAIPLFGSTLTTAFAFAPLALMPGPAGEFVGSIAISVILAIFGSLFLSMTVIAALTGIFSSLRREPLPGSRLVGETDYQAVNKLPEFASHQRTETWWNDGLRWPSVRRLYESTLSAVFQRPWLGILIGVAFPVFGFIQGLSLPEQFFPPADRDQLHIELDLPNQASIANTQASARAIADELVGHPRVKRVDWFLGESAPSFYYNVIPRKKNFSNYAQAIVTLDSAENISSLIHELQATVDAKFAADRVLIRQLEQGPPFDAPIEVRLFGPSLDGLREYGAELRSILTGTPGVIHSRCDLQEAKPKIRFQVDEEKARLAGLTNEEIARQLSNVLEGSVGGSVLEETEELPVRIRLGNAARKDLPTVRGIEILGKAESFDDDSTQSEFEMLRGVPLASLGQDELVNEVATIVHLSGRRMNEIQTFVPAGVLPADVLRPFKVRLEESGFEERLPSGYEIEYGGEAAKRDEAVDNLFSYVSILMVLMAATLVLSFSSFRLAALIATVAMLSIGLGLGALWLFGYPFGFMAIVGTMGLVGVAINDSIVVLAAIRADEAARRGDLEAIRGVVVHASRHILSTSLTTMAGFTPLILAGGGFWPPLAVTIAGGVLGATILALYYVPSLYLLIMCRDGRRSSPSSADSVPS